MSKSRLLKFNTPALFVPSKVRSVIDPGSPTGFLDFNSVKDRNIGTTSSFRYDPPGAGLRSTQQLGVDYSEFRNHIFFQSAQVSTNVAFNELINRFPFDGTRKQIEEFVDSLTGYQKWIYDNFPKNKGYLLFSSSFVTVQDFAGSVFPTISSNQTGDSVLDPGTKSLTWEMWIALPDIVNDNQVVCQKLSGSNQGISLFVSQSAVTSSADVVFTVTSASLTFETTASLTKGQFNHLVATYNRKPGVNKLQLYVNETLESETNTSLDFGTIDFQTSNLYIGSGSSCNVPGGTFTPQETFSGSLDEFRFFHDVRTPIQQEASARKSVYQDENLVLYFKFNEPSGTIGATAADTVNSVVIDYSGNSLHSLITNYTSSLRNTGSQLTNPMQYEDLSLSPVLFPNYQPIVDFNAELLTSASNYDASNPNLITRLIPRHYLLEGQALEAFDSEDGTIIDAYSGEDIPGSGELGQAQIIQSMLYITSQFFDEMKLYLDSFGKALNVSYDGIDAVPDQLLVKVAEYYGVTLPSLFDEASITQFINAEDLGVDYAVADQSLKSVQNQIWRRILVNLKDIIQSKGTLHSIKAFIRTLGIDPDSTFRIREFGGPTRKNLKNQYDIRTEVSTMLDMSGSDALVVSPALSGTRVEIGFPDIAGTYVNKTDSLIHGTSNSPSDGLLTSGSFTYEGFYRFPINREYNAIQSLVRLEATGSDSTMFSGNPGVLANVVALSGTSKDIKLFARPSYNDTGTNSLEMVLSGVNVFDGNQWNVSFGRNRNDDPIEYLSSGSTKSNISSSYFLRAARAERGRIIEEYVTQSFFQANNSADLDAFEIINGTYNVSGAYFAIGSQSLNTGGSTSYRYLNNTGSVTDDTARGVTFQGKVGHMRFWSLGLLKEEWREHVINFKSLGVENPEYNFNFENTTTGSWGKIRVDTSTDQIVTESNSSGIIYFDDFSQNNYCLTGSGFEASKRVINPETFYFGYLTPKFDEASTSNKVRARGYLDPDLAERRGAKFGVVNKIDANERPSDDTRFSINFSIIDALDQDIINLFASFEELDSALGSPELLYSPDYPGLEELRSIYFNRLTDKINLKSFFEFFKWFDKNIGNFISALVPRKTKFRGVNFVIESHMLERAKFENLNVDQYLNISQRNSEKGNIFLRQFTSNVKKY